MKSTHRLLHLRLLLVIALVLGSLIVGRVPISAQTGTVVSNATPSDATPAVGNTITVTVNIDMTGVDAPDNKLGSFTGTLAWNTDVLSYQSAALQGVFAGGVINDTNVGAGQLTFNSAYAAGATGNINVLIVTFNVAAAGSSTLDLEYSAMAAATTFANLLPMLTVNDGQVEVTSGGNYILTMAVGPTGGGTTDPEVGPHTYAAGTVVDITATPNTGYEFDYWDGAVANPDSASTTVTMNMAKTVTALDIVSGGRAQRSMR